MRPSLLFALVLIGALALIGTAAASAENFQNGPGMFYVPSGSTQTSIEYGASSVTVPSPYADTFILERNSHFNTYSPGGPSNYLAFVSANDVAHTVGTTSYATFVSSPIYAIDEAGQVAGTISIECRFRNTDNPTTPHAMVWEVVRADGKLSAYCNGVLVRTGRDCPTVPYLYKFGNNFDSDDVVTTEPVAGIVGVMPHDWFISKDIANPLLSGVYTPEGENPYNSEMHATWTAFQDTAGAYMCIDGDQQVQYVGTESMLIRDSDSVYRNTTFRSGHVTFNLTQFMAENNYGRHTVELHVGGETIAEEFWYVGTASHETNITWDRDIYAAQDSVQIASSIGDAYYQPGYSFEGRLIYINPVTGGAETKETWAITTQTHTHSTSVTTDLFPVSGRYIVELYSKQGEIASLLDYDTAQVYVDKVVYSGTVWDGLQRTVIDGATVSVKQMAATSADTTGSDGRFEILDLQKDVLSELSATKTGFTTTWANMTPTEYKRYEFDLVLLNSSYVPTGSVIFGTVRDAATAASIAGAAVAVSRDGAPVNSTTSAEKGFYIFDGLDANTTYTIAVDKAGYAHHSNGVPTGAAGSLTQYDPWLLPQSNYNLTVHLKDAVTNATITRLMAVSTSGQSKQTTNGTVTFAAVPGGACYVAVVGDGYTAYETQITMDADKEITLLISPAPVVVTTTPGLTPTPTPAIVDLGGTVYDGMTGLPIVGATVNVSTVQGNITRSDTSDSKGAYAIPNIQNNVLTFINATATGYRHTDFSFTPQGATSYQYDIVMYRTDEATNATHPPDAGMAGAGGMVLGGWAHQPVNSPTVTASNGTWSGEATYDNSGEYTVWYFTALEPNGVYNFTAAKSGYVSKTVQATMGGANSFTTVEIVLAQVYSLTIEIKDIESKAKILKPVEVTCSNGVKQNTSTGSTIFSNLLYQEYVFSATSDGYQEGGIAALAYADHTEIIYLSKLPSGAGNATGIEYSIPPKHVELITRSIFGSPLSGVSVTVKGQSTTLPDPGLLDAIFGWTDDYSDVNLANATMTGTTGPDGAVSFLLTDTVRYLITFSDPARGISQTTELYPHDTQYVYILGSGVGGAPAAGMPNMTLWTGDAGATTTLYGQYTDPAGTTTALWFVVESQNGTVRTEIMNQSLGAVQTASPSYAVNHTTGDQYVWGFRATTPDRGTIEQWSGITLHSRLIDLGIEEFWYFWISACFLFIFAGMFSGMTSRFGFVLLPLFAMLLWYIGWLETGVATLAIAMIAGVLMYISRVQVGG